VCSIDRSVWRRYTSSRQTSAPHRTRGEAPHPPYASLPFRTLAFGRHPPPTLHHGLNTLTYRRLKRSQCGSRLDGGGGGARNASSPRRWRVCIVFRGVFNPPLTAGGREFSTRRRCLRLEGLATHVSEGWVAVLFYAAPLTIDGLGAWEGTATRGHAQHGGRRSAGSYRRGGGCGANGFHAERRRYEAARRSEDHPLSVDEITQIYYCHPPKVGGCRTVAIIMQRTWTTGSAKIRKEYLQFWLTCE